MQTVERLSLVSYLSRIYGILSILFSLGPVIGWCVVEMNHGPGDDLGSPGNVYVWFSYVLMSLIAFGSLQVFALIIKIFYTLEMRGIFIISILIWLISLIAIHFVGVL